MLTVSRSAVDFSGLGGIWDGPSHSGNVYCGQMNQYFRYFLGGMDAVCSGPKKKRIIQTVTSNKSKSVAGLNDRKGCIFTNDEVDQTKHEIFCVHIVCNEIQVKVNLEITTFFFYLRFPYCPNFFWFGVVYIYIQPQIRKSWDSMENIYIYKEKHHQLLNSNLRSLAGTEPETHTFLKHCALYPITYDSAELMNAMTNQKRSDESSPKRRYFITAHAGWLNSLTNVNSLIRDNNVKMYECK